MAKLDSIQNRNLPLFSPAHLRMLRSLYESDSKEEHFLLIQAEEFMRSRVYLIKLKAEMTKARESHNRAAQMKVGCHEDQISLGIMSRVSGAKGEREPLTAHQITMNLLLHRCLRLRHILLFHSEKYVRLLESINNVLSSLYQSLHSAILHPELLPLSKCVQVIFPSVLTDLTLAQNQALTNMNHANIIFRCYNSS